MPAPVFDGSGDFKGRMCMMVLKVCVWYSDSSVMSLTYSCTYGARGLWFINATSFFSKADQRATVRTVAVAMGRPGLTILQQISVLISFLFVYTQPHA